MAREWYIKIDSSILNDSKFSSVVRKHRELQRGVPNVSWSTVFD